MLFFKKKQKKECEPIDGGSFRVSYIDDGVEVLFSHVPIGCPEDAYEDIYIPTKEGYTFDGWYYDQEFKEKVNVTNTINLPRTPTFDENECQTGYKDIVLYAKWIKNE